jgi:hypothetical protein
MSTAIGSPEWIEKVTKAARDNRANQMNPEHPAYWSSRSECISLPSIDIKPAALAIGAVIGAAAVGTIWAVHKYLREPIANLFRPKDDKEEIAEVEFEEDYLDEDEEEE